MSYRDKYSKPEHERHRGTRHLRVGIRIGARGAGVESIWLVEQPAVQASSLVETVLTRVDLGGRLVLVQAFADPRVTRGTYREKFGHSYGAVESGTIYVSVPFNDVRELAEVRIRVMQPLKSRGPATDHAEVASLFDRASEPGILLADLGTTSLQAHTDWPNLALELHIPVEAGRFEIFVDAAGAYRWRLKRGGNILAEGIHSHPSREACEEELRWIRRQALSLPVIPMDVPGAQH